MKVSIRRLDEDLPLPAYAHSGDAGLDLFSAHDVTIDPGGRMAIPTGIAVAIPPGYAGFVHARSGRALNEGLALANAPGLIDTGYRGEIKVIVVNLDT
ncbi:MAG: dUTP diphosphatase, partial [Actinomycetota bacterium]